MTIYVYIYTLILVICYSTEEICPVMNFWDRLKKTTDVDKNLWIIKRYIEHFHLNNQDMNRDANFAILEKIDRH